MENMAGFWRLQRRYPWRLRQFKKQSFEVRIRNLVSLGSEGFSKGQWGSRGDLGSSVWSDLGSSVWGDLGRSGDCNLAQPVSSHTEDKMGKMMGLNPLWQKTLMNYWTEEWKGDLVISEFLSSLYIRVNTITPIYKIFTGHIIYTLFRVTVNTVLP